MKDSLMTNKYPQIYSYPIFLESVDSAFLDALWTLPKDMDDAFRNHCERPSLSLEHIFRLRLAGDPLPMGWEWMLVVLPSRYPIAGHLAEIRGGGKNNMLMWDFETLHEIELCEKRSGRRHMFPVPRASAAPTGMVSALWIPTKGIMKAIAERNGGWIASLYESVRHVPPENHWLCLAEAPPTDWIASVSEHNLQHYQAWSERHCGPPWLAGSDPTNHAVCSLLLNIASHSTEDGSRFRNLRKYLKLRPNDARGWAMMGFIYSERGGYGRAIVCARRAIAIAPQWVYPCHLLMRCLPMAKKMIEACQLAHELLEIMPLDPTSNFIAAESSYSLGKKAEAIMFMEKALQLDPFHKRWLIKLGKWHLSNRDVEATKECYKRILQLDPESATNLNNYGYLLALSGDYEQALAFCEKACRLERTIHTLDSLGYVYLKMGSAHKARLLFLEALALKPDHKEAVEHLAETEAVLSTQSPEENPPNT